MFYKEINTTQTSIGNLPKDWKVVLLRDIAQVKGGKRLPKGEKLVDYKTGFPYIRVVDFKNGKVDVPSVKYLLPETYKKIKNYTISSDDVYISIAGTVGLAGLIPPELNGANLTENAAKLCELREVRKEFLSYLLNSRFLRKQIIRLIGKGTQPKLALFRIESLKLPLPPLQEQERIAQVLGVVDSAVELVDKVIAKTERLKKGLMQTLLTRGIGHKEYKQTPIGTIPKTWKVVKLHELAENKSDIVAGPFGSNLKVCDYRQEGIPIIRLQNIERNRFVNRDLKYISLKKAEELKYHSFRAGDIVLAKLGDPIGKTCIVPDYLKFGVVVADVVRIRLSLTKANKYFFTYILNSSICAKQLRKETIGSTRPRVNISQVRNLKVPLPSLPEQQKIAEILSNVDRKLELDRNEKARLERIKRGLMDLLLTGKIRVKVD